MNHSKANRPWNHDKELSVVHVENEITKHRKEAPKPIKHSFTIKDMKPDEIIFADNDLDDEELEAVKSLDDQAVDQYRVEKRYHDRVSSWFKHEARAYFHLPSLQGLCIPEFYGTTTFNIDSINEMPPGILIEVPGILIQFLNGITLDELEPDSPIALKYPHIGETAVNCVRQLTLRGVLHGDIRLPNFIVREDGRVFIFDFAFARFRESDVPDEEWNAKVTQMEEELLAKIFVDEKGLRDKTPPEPYVSNGCGYRFFNREIERSRECWINKYYEPVIDPDDFEYRVDDNGEGYRFYLPNWKLKNDSVNKRKIYLESLNSWYLTNNLDCEENHDDRVLWT